MLLDVLPLWVDVLCMPELVLPIFVWWVHMVGCFFSSKLGDVSLCFLWTCLAFCHVGVMCWSLVCRSSPALHVCALSVAVWQWKGPSWVHMHERRWIHNIINYMPYRYRYNAANQPTPWCLNACEKTWFIYHCFQPPVCFADVCSLYQATFRAWRAGRFNQAAGAGPRCSTRTFRSTSATEDLDLAASLARWKNYTSIDPK